MKVFRIVLAINRDSDTLKAFITSNIAIGNYLVKGGWSGHDWINARNSGYRHYEHIHSHNDFGRGLESTSHIEGVWAQLKSEIKSTYKMIPSFNLLFFIKEAEWKIKTRNLTFNEKSDDFFSMFNLVNLVGDDNIMIDEHILSNEDINHYIN